MGPLVTWEQVRNSASQFISDYSGIIIPIIAIPVALYLLSAAVSIIRIALGSKDPERRRL